MTKRFHKRSILRPEVTKEEEEYYRKLEAEEDTKNKKAPTAIFDGINYDDSLISMRNANREDLLQGDDRTQNEEDEWVQERN